MRIAVVDPSGRSIKFLDERGSPEVFAQRHVGPEETAVLRIERKSVSLDDPKLGKIPVMRQIPVFGQKRW
jgi:hypothetical protein